MTATRKKNDYWVNTNCCMCYANCSCRIHVVDGVMVKIEGEPNSDMGPRGGLCGKGQASIMNYYDPNRILYPVKRTNPKKGLLEDPKWQRISWEEALDTISGKLLKAREKTPNSAVWAGTPSPGSPMSLVVPWAGFWLAYGSHNSAFGGVGLHCGNGAHFGAGLYHCSWSVVPDYRYCNLAIQFGSNKGSGSGHSSGITMRQAAEARVRGMRNIIFDPICNFAGGKGTEWFPIRPGTDNAVILSMCNVIVNEIGVYDIEFIRDKTTGPYLVGPDKLNIKDSSGKILVWDTYDDRAKPYDDRTLSKPALEGEYNVNGVRCEPGWQLIKEHLKKFTPEMASEISTVPAKEIKRIAHEWIEEARIGSVIEIDGEEFPYRPVSSVMIRGGQGHANAFHQYFSMCLLDVLAGNLEAVGGTISWGAYMEGYPETGRPHYKPYSGVDGFITPGMWFTADPWPPHPVKWPELMTLQDLFVHCHVPGYPYGDDFEEIWDKVGRPYEAEVLGIFGGNLVKTVANAFTVEKFLKKVPFIFSLNTIHNETTEGFADIVLPDAHAYESLNIALSIGFMFNHPMGLDNWSFCLRQPVVEKRGETRDLFDIMFDLADRVGVRSKYNNFLDSYISGRGATWMKAASSSGGNLIVQPDEKITNEKFTDRALKVLFGEEHDLKWFRNYGFINWKKKPKEAYWRYYTEGRVPIYFEFLERERESIKKIAKELDIECKWEQYTPLLDYFPSVIYEEGGPCKEFDMIAFSYRDILHTGSGTIENPWIREMSESNPYTLNIAMNVETAMEKGIKEGDIIRVENVKGLSVQGKVKLMRGIHKELLGFVGSLGGWAKGQPIGYGQGPFFNNLLMLDMEHICPITQSIETAVRVKVKKVATIGDIRETLRMG